MTSVAGVCLALLVCQQLQKHCPLRIGVRLRKALFKVSQILLVNVLFHCPRSQGAGTKPAVTEGRLEDGRRWYLHGSVLRRMLGIARLAGG
jgi:hypothetical protein